MNPLLIEKYDSFLQEGKRFVVRPHGNDIADIIENVIGGYTLHAIFEAPFIQRWVKGDEIGPAASFVGIDAEPYCQTTYGVERLIRATMANGKTYVIGFFCELDVGGA